MCGVTHVAIAALFCSSSLLRTSNSDWATGNEAWWSVSVTDNEEPAGENCHHYSSVVTAIIPYLYIIKLQHALLGDYWVCVQPAWLPVLTWIPSSIPPGNNIQNTFPAGFMQDTIYTIYVPSPYQFTFTQNTNMVFYTRFANFRMTPYEPFWVPMLYQHVRLTNITMHALMPYKTALMTECFITHCTAVRVITTMCG